VAHVVEDLLIGKVPLAKSIQVDGEFVFVQQGGVVLIDPPYLLSPDQGGHGVLVADIDNGDPLLLSLFDP
jgi:hypothetical protein